MHCTVSVRHSGDVAIIDLAGRVMQTAGADAVRDAIKAELDHGRKNILLNLDGVDFIDSSGLGTLASSFITVSRLGGRMKLLNTQSRVDSMLQVTRLYTVFVTFTDEREAVASFS
ncbi:MAG: anti-anti-sigma factor [Candidatus Solibacter sp.]|jgi:anti-anti-sigma factor|nr:anti-anti-sigma factor [Candidatus Solibacter sp.]